jgi:hypothetical protein
MLARCAGCLGSLAAWQEAKHRQRGEKHDPKAPGQVIIGQHGRLPLDHTVHQGESLALGGNRPLPLLSPAACPGPAQAAAQAAPASARSAGEATLRQ